MQLSASPPPPGRLPVPMTDSATCPAAMASYLRSVSAAGEARCFAQAIHDQAAWANASWAAFWSDVVRLV